MNILTFDIEEWYLNKAYWGGNSQMYYEYDRLLDHILTLLDEKGINATFFCLGKMASDFPHIVKKIHSFGHEIGSHSNTHVWINKMTPEEFQNDTYSAVSALEDTTGQKIKSFRAPAFSIGESNKWAFEILAENGIENDASIFPGNRDFGGFPDFSQHRPCKIQYNGISINEFPIPLYRIPVINKEIAYSGGGYFRLLPYSFVKNRMLKSDYNMCYFHIGDLITTKAPMYSRQDYEYYYKESGPFIKRFSRYFKSNVGRGNALKNLDKLLSEFKFISIRKFNNSHSINTSLHL